MTGTDETWARVSNAIQQGQRGLASGSTLAKLLTEHRSVRNTMNLPPLTVQQILAWADIHKAVTGGWPKMTSGQVMGTDETWARIFSALQQGQRGLPAGSSLAQLLAEHRSVRNRKELPSLTIKQILAWACEHKTATGEWPSQYSGQVTGTDETWTGIQISMRAGRRGLPGGSSLAKLLAEQHDVRNIHDLPPLTIKQILVWADAHKKRTGNWPHQKSGQVTGADETWTAINYALRAGRRGLPSGSTLAQLLAKSRSIGFTGLLSAGR